MHNLINCSAVQRPIAVQPNFVYLTLDAGRLEKKYALKDVMGAFIAKMKHMPNSKKWKSNNYVN